jgi:hypothetical protein
MKASSTPARQATRSKAELRRVIEAQGAEITLLRLTVDKLKLQLFKRVRAEFGSASEQFDAVQMALIPGAPLDKPAPAKPSVAPTPLDAANAPAIDRSLPAHLPRLTEVLRPDATPAHHDAAGQPCGCSACGGRLRQIGADVSEQLEYVPAHFKVIRHVRPKLACVACEAIFQASAPSRPSHRARHGRAGPVGPRHGLEVLRPPTSVPAKPHLPPRRGGDRPLHAGRLDRPG